MSQSEDLLAITELVRAGRATTRGEIGKALSLRSTSVSELVRTLVSQDILRENTSPPRGRGRPTTYLSFNQQRLAGMVISVVGKTLIAKAVDLAYRVIAEQSVTPSPNADNDEMTTCIRELVQSTREKIPHGVILSTIALSISGVLDKPRSLLCFSSRWPNLKDLDLNAILADQGCGVDIIRNLDAELGGIQLKQSHLANENALLLHWGQGIGASFSADGIIVNKSRGRFCEIGHWGLGNESGKGCTCGGTDCLETVAALWAIGPELKNTFPELSLNESELAEQLRGIDPMKCSAMAEGLSQVLRLTINLCRLLFPDRIILTGPFVENPAIFKRFVMALESASLLDTHDSIQVTVSASGMQDEILGALHHPLEIELQNLITNTNEITTA